jgi:hypothetical protein
LTAGTRLFWLTEIATIRQEAAKVQLDHHLFLIIPGAMIHKAPQPCEIADVKDYLPALSKARQRKRDL